MLPNHPDAYAAHGSVLLTLGRYEAALSEFDKARTLAPTSVLILNQYANALLKLRRVGEALEFYGQVLKLQPGNADGHHNRGSALLQLHQYQAAIDSYDEALRLHAARPETLIGKSHALSELGRHMEARACLDQAWHLNPKHDFLAGQALLARLEICDWSDYLQHCANLATAVGAGERAIAPLAFVMVSDSAALQLECARIHAQAHWGGVAAGPSAPRGYGHERVRIAYVTANLAEHPVSYLMSGVFEAHDRERFELIAIALQPAEDSAAGRRAAGAFSRVIDVSAESDAEAAALLRALEVDIAVDLMGYTKQARPGIFAHRAAPVQINYLGFPGTMGAPFMDYILADEFVIPPSRCASFAEQVVYLPGCFQANDDRRIIASPPTRAEAGLPEHNLVFCSFNKSSKLNPILFDVWCRILCAVEGSVLWLVADGAQTPGNLHREAARRGLDPGRLVFAAPLPYAQHLGRLGLADLFLDTLPFNAGTTCSDALWAGLPVLTCAGDALAARMAGSLLRAAGLPELVTYSLQEYEQRAFELANEPRRLTELRQRLAENRLRQPLFDTARFCRHLELAFMQMRATAERGLPPKGFAVEPLQLDV
jgi:predicted O-linked N-acetylglucosamine transferase (SPINDLY family)